MQSDPTQLYNEWRLQAMLMCSATMYPLPWSSKYSRIAYTQALGREDQQVADD
jgi:hypothetical protein